MAMSQLTLERWETQISSPHQAEGELELESPTYKVSALPPG